MMKNFTRLLLSVLLCSLPMMTGGSAFAAGGKSSDDVMINDPLAKKITGSKNYVSMFGIRASITQGFSVAGFIAVDAGFDVPEGKIRKQIHATRPRIKDALRHAISSYVNGPYQMGTAPDLDIMRARMQRALDRQIGEGNATVMLASVIVFSE